MFGKQASNRDIITFHVGNFGCKVGFSMWRLFCKEHGVQLDGTIDPNFKNEEFTTRRSLYHEYSDGTWIPKTLFIDQNLGMMDELQTGNLRQLFDANQFYSPNLSQKGIYASVKYSTEFVAVNTETLSRMRMMYEQSNAPTSSLLFRSTSGGTCALTTNMLQYSSESALTNAVITLDPSHSMANRIIGPYNHVLCTAESFDHSDVIIPLQNCALYKIMRKFNDRGSEVTFSQLNDLIAYTISHLTPDRYIPNENTIPMSLEEICTNGVCFPKLKFLVPRTGRTHTFCSNDWTRCDRIGELLVTNLGAGSAMTANVDLGVHITLCLAFRGSGLNVSSAISHTENFRNKIMKNKKFISWMPYFTKVGLIPFSVDVPKDFKWKFATNSFVGFDNTTGMHESIKLALNDFSGMFVSKSFLHLYTQESMDHNEFEQAYDLLLDIANYYEKLPDLQESPTN